MLAQVRQAKTIMTVQRIRRSSPDEGDGRKKGHSKEEQPFFGNWGLESGVRITLSAELFSAAKEVSCYPHDYSGILKS